MQSPGRIFIAVFEEGRVVERIGNSIAMPKDRKSRNALILFMDSFTGLLDSYYNKIGKEYIAFDYEYEKGGK